MSVASERSERVWFTFLYLESSLYVLLTFIQIANSSKAEVPRGWNLTDILRLGVSILKYAKMSLECQLWHLSSSSVFYMSDFYMHVSDQRHFTLPRIPSYEQRLVQLNHSLYWNFHLQLVWALIFKHPKSTKENSTGGRFLSGWFRWNGERPKILSLVFERVMH